MDLFPTSSETYEETHVHSVYEAIAPHFSSTRYKPWPLVATFLSSLPAYSLGVDLGCGNGKNLLLGPSHFCIGSDRSAALVSIATDRCRDAVLASKGASASSGADVVLADALAPPHPLGRFDFAISIAVIHHFSTGERRVEAVRRVLEVLRPGRREGKKGEGEGVGVEGGGTWIGGKGLVYVWALEQTGSRRGWGGEEGGGEQDVMVPWVLSPPRKGRSEKRGEKNKEEPRKGEEEGGEDETGKRTFERYYHLYRKGELERDVTAAGGVVLEAGYEKDNWWAIIGRLAEG